MGRSESRKRAGRRRSDRLRLRAWFRPLLEILEDRTLLTTYTVINTLDTGGGSSTSGDLRYCITQANAAGGTNTIQFGVSGTIALAGALPNITDNGLTIAGPGASSLTVQGGSSTYTMLFVANGASLTLQNLTISGGSNTTSSGYGGAIHDSGTLTVQDCVFSNNTALQGGAIDADGTLHVFASTFANNRATGSGNPFGGALYVAGTVTVDGSTFTGNQVISSSGVGGGAIVNAYSTLTITNSTFAGNSAPLGGAIENVGTLNLVQSTLTGNTSTFGGGGLTTFSGYTSNVWNTIIAGNSASGGSGSDVSDSVTSLGHNLIGITDGSSGWVASDLTGTAANPLNAKLASLQSNGGTTQTVGLLPGSPAIDAGDSSATATYGLTTDQRGLTRLADGSGSGAATVDIGAFEVQDYVVTTTVDSGQGSLRQALLDNNNAGYGRISFQIGASGSTATIQPLDQGGGVSLPVIGKTVFLDGWSQGGVGYSGHPLIQLDGTLAATSGLGTFGLNIQADNVVVRGLAIDRFADVGGNGFAIGIFAGTADNRDAWIYGNYLGTDPTGTLAEPNGQGGIWLGTNANGNTIGGNGAGADNVISGNSGIGIWVQSTGNLISGNFIGTNAAGTNVLGNGAAGVAVTANNNTIGGATSGPANLISGNSGFGVDVSNSTGNVVLGNFIGTDVHGTINMGNGSGGIRLSSANNTVGGTSASARNIISGNNSDGVQISGAGATGNVVLGNFIGTDVNGTTNVGNGGAGVALFARNNTVGGTSASARNLISGNNSVGVGIGGAGGAGNLVVGNFIGTDVHGTTNLGNGAGGVALFAPNNTVGGTSASARNLISGNNTFGLEISGAGAIGNVVLGNYLGTDVNGTSAVANGSDGVLLTSAASNTIGGTTAGSGNVISGNFGNGVDVTGSPASGNLLAGNYIGTDAHGTAVLGNILDGVLVFGASHNTIGASGAGNIISGNSANGVELSSGSSGNLVFANYIGLDVHGTAALGNTADGVAIVSASDNTIGRSGAGNLISGNSGNGVQISGTTATGNLVFANYLGTDTHGTAALGNIADGVLIRGASHNTIGQAGAGNVISGNSSRGVEINSGGSGNLVVGNFIGIDATGSAARANGSDGVLLTSAANNTIGGASGLGNVISANSGNGVQIAGAASTGNVVLGNFIGTKANGTSALANAADGVLLFGASQNTVGGLIAAARNLISGNHQNGVEINGGSANAVLNNYLGTDVDGTTALANTSDGILVSGAANNTLGAPGAGNLISGNGSRGVEISSNASGNRVLANLIGTNAAGTAALGNAADGVLVGSDATNNTVGGTTAGSANVISGNHAQGVDLTGSGTTGNLVLGNYLGTNAAGASLGNSADGVLVAGGATSNRIGGTSSGAGNTISFNARGVGVTGTTTTGNAILGNVITGNSGLGIDLGDDGVTPDGTTPRSFPNDGQNFPVLAYSFSTGGATTVGGTLSGAPDTTYRVELFANQSQDSSGFGPGSVFLAFINVTTDAGGNASFTATSLPGLAVGTYVSATATSPTGDTSEFSADVLVTGPTAAFIAVGGFPSAVVAGTPHDFTVTASDSSGHVTPGYTGTVHFTSDDPRAVLPADYSFTPADRGTHTFTAALETAGTHSLTVAQTTAPSNGQPGIATSRTGITVLHAPFAQFRMMTAATTLEGSPLNLTVTATDPFDNLVPDYAGTVEFTSSDPLATLPANYTFVADNAGTHTFTAILESAGPQTITVADTAVLSDQGSATTAVANQPPSFVAVAALPSTTTAGITLSVVLADAGQHDTFILFVDWGDHSGTQTVFLLPGSTTIAVRHVYGQEGTYPVGVQVVDRDGASASTGLAANVLLPGTSDVGIAEAPPNSTVTATSVGVSATLQNSSNKASLILVADVATPAAQGLVNNPSPNLQSVTVSYDVRAINVDNRDRAVVTFQFPAGTSNPTILYFDKASGTYRPVHSDVPFVVDTANHTVTVVFDNLSTPGITALTGTIFTVSVLQSQAVSVAVTAPTQLAQANTRTTSTQDVSDPLSELPTTTELSLSSQGTVALAPSQAGSASSSGGTSSDTPPADLPPELRQLMQDLLDILPSLSSHLLEAGDRSVVGRPGPETPTTPAQGDSVPDQSAAPTRSTAPSAPVERREGDHEEQESQETPLPVLTPEDERWLVFLNRPGKPLLETPGLSAALALVGGTLLAGGGLRSEKDEDEEKAFE